MELMIPQTIGFPHRAVRLPQNLDATEAVIKIPSLPLMLLRLRQAQTEVPQK